MELRKYQNDPDKQHEILGIEADSIAMELDIRPGDRLVSINGKVVHDALDYHLFVKEEVIDLVIYKKDHDEAWLYEIEKDEDEDLGLIFDNNLMDEYRSCRNKCLFCFIDQLPDGMRETLYFKDDDARLSFLQGNYITLTNMTEREVSRVIEYHLSPINISIHTMDPALRKEMLGNRFADRILDYMNRLFEAGITMNGQIVLCKGINDGQALDYSISQLEKYLPHMQSVSVVPVGISRHREGLFPLEPFNGQEAGEVLETIHKWQDYFYAQHGTHFIHAGDEFYILAGQSLPDETTYDGYLQLENGVGMVRLLIDASEEAIRELKPRKISPKKFSLVTGRLIESTLRTIMKPLEQKIEGLELQVIGIDNNFFGEHITVSGLLVGKDIMDQVQNFDLGERVFLPDNIFRSMDTVLLDDVTLEQLEASMSCPLTMIPYLGETLVSTIVFHALNKGDNI